MESFRQSLYSQNENDIHESLLCFVQQKESFSISELEIIRQQIESQEKISMTLKLNNPLRICIQCKHSKSKKCPFQIVFKAQNFPSSYSRIKNISTISSVQNFSNKSLDSQNSQTLKSPYSPEYQNYQYHNLKETNIQILDKIPSFQKEINQKNHIEEYMNKMSFQNEINENIFKQECFFSELSFSSLHLNFNEEDQYPNQADNSFIQIQDLNSQFDQHQKPKENAQVSKVLNSQFFLEKQINLSSNEIFSKSLLSENQKNLFSDQSNIKINILSHENLKQEQSLNIQQLDNTQKLNSESQNDIIISNNLQINSNPFYYNQDILQEDKNTINSCFNQNSAEYDKIIDQSKGEKIYKLSQYRLEHRNHKVMNDTEFNMYLAKQWLESYSTYIQMIYDDIRANKGPNQKITPKMIKNILLEKYSIDIYAKCSETMDKKYLKKKLDNLIKLIRQKDKKCHYMQP